MSWGKSNNHKQRATITRFKRYFVFQLYCSENYRLKLHPYIYLKNGLNTKSRLRGSLTSERCQTGPLPQPQHPLFKHPWKRSFTWCSYLLPAHRLDDVMGTSRWSLCKCQQTESQHWQINIMAVYAVIAESSAAVNTQPHLCYQVVTNM